MEIARQSRFETTRLETTRREVRSYDVTIMLGYSFLAVLLMIAIYWAAMSSGAAPGDFASMTVYP